MQTVYKDLHYYQEALNDMAHKGTESLMEKDGLCMVDAVSKKGACAIYCNPQIRPEQELFCHMLDQVAPRLNDTLEHMITEVRLLLAMDNLTLLFNMVSMANFEIWTHIFECSS